MAACSTWKYSRITPAVFQNLREIGRQRGFAIPGAPSGQFTIQVAGFQVSFQYAWSSAAGTLALSCMSKPGLLGCATIKGFADKIVAQSGGKPG